MNYRKKAFLELHLAVFLFGFTAILGELIALSAFMIVWWRVLLAPITMLFFIRSANPLMGISKKDFMTYFGIGWIVALHWLCFYGSIKFSNASVALVCMATSSLFTAFLEPLIVKTRTSWLEVFAGILIIPIMVLIANNISFEMIDGLLLGILSAFLAALFGSLNKKFIHRADPMRISFIELSSAWVFLTLVLPFVFHNNSDAQFFPVGIDWFYISVLVLFCTTLAYYLSLRVLRHISAFMTNLVINLEPVYGILLAIVILQEHKQMNASFYLGVILLLAVVLSFPFFKI